MHEINRPAYRFPVPTDNLTNREFDAPPQTEWQKLVEQSALSLTDRFRKGHGMDRRSFLRSAAGMATLFLAMNSVYGPYFEVAAAEASEPGQAEERASQLSDQLIFDDQLHFVHDNFSFEGLLDLREYASKHWNPEIRGEKRSFEKLRFRNFLEEVFLRSDTKIGLLSGAPSDIKENWFLTNDQIAGARRLVNGIAGSRRMLCHFVIAPGVEGWLGEMDRAVTDLKPDSWKGYTVGDPLSLSHYPWRLDDEKLMYPAYEKMVKSGIVNVCIHKGLVPNDYLNSYPLWKYATVDDLPKAAKDWPQLRFIIYHSALRPVNSYPEEHLEKFERTGRIDWVSDLAEIPAKHGLSNVYAEIGTAFGSSAVAHPRHAAALLGILIKGMGADHVLWGTDSVWYGSPQWQIEAFRRIEIPEDLQKKYSFAPLGGARSEVKQKIMWDNGLRLYGMDPSNTADLLNDRFSVCRKQPAKDWPAILESLEEKLAAV